MTTLPSRISSARRRISAIVAGRRRSPASCPSGRLRCAWRFRFRLRASAARPCPSRACTCAPGRWCGRIRSPPWTARLRLLLRLPRRVAAVGAVLFSSSVSASGVCSYTATPMSLSMATTTSMRLGIDQLLGQVVGDFGVRQVAAGLAQLDQGLQALAALGHVLFGQDGLVEAELLHQGAFLRLADLHAQRLDLFFGRALGRRLSPARSSSMSDRSMSSGPPASSPAFGLRPRLAPVAGARCAAALGGRPDLLRAGGLCKRWDRRRECVLVGTVFTFVALLTPWRRRHPSWLPAARRSSTVFLQRVSWQRTRQASLNWAYDLVQQDGPSGITRASKPGAGRTQTLRLGEREPPGSRHKARCRANIWCAVLAVY